MKAIADGNLDEAGLSPAERALLDYVTRVTEAAYRTTDDDVQGLRDHGWTEPQIAEAVYITRCLPSSIGLRMLSGSLRRVTLR